MTEENRLSEENDEVFTDIELEENINKQKEILKNAETMEIFIDRKRGNSKILVNGKMLGYVQKVELSVDKPVRISFPKITNGNKLEDDWVDVCGLVC